MPNDTPSAETPNGVPDMPEPETPPTDEQDSGEQPDDEVVVPEDLTDVEEEQLRSLHSQLDDARTAARDAREPERVRAAMEAQNRIAGEINRRRAEQQRIDQELETLDSAEVAPLPEPVPALAGAGATAAQLASVREPQTVTEQAPPPPVPERPRAALLAAAGNDVVPPGAELSWAQFGQAIERSKRGRGMTVLASIPSFEAMIADGVVLPEPLTDRNGAIRNDELIGEAVEDWRVRRNGEASRMASARQGAICEPFETIRTIDDAFDASTPVENIFPTRPAGRGGFQWSPSGVLTDVAGGANLWDEADQANVDVDTASTWKSCIDYACPDIDTAVLEAVYTCVRYDITLEMSNPERVRNLNNALTAARARLKEGRLLQRIDQLSHGFVFTGDYGALPALIEAVNSLLPQLPWWNRQERGNYDLILPPGLVEVLRIDRANRAYGVEAETSDVLTYVRGNTDVDNVVVALDPSLGGEPGTFSDPLPDVGNQVQAGAIPYISGSVFRIRLVDPSAAIYASTGEMNAGTLRDANLVRMNKTALFAEEFFFLAKQGPQPWATIDIELCADGARAGLVDPSGCLVS